MRCSGGGGGSSREPCSRNVSHVQVRGACKCAAPCRRNVSHVQVRGALCEVSLQRGAFLTFVSRLDGASAASLVC